MVIIIASISSNLSVPEAVMRYHLLNIKYWLHTSYQPTVWLLSFGLSSFPFQLYYFLMIFIYASSDLSSFCCVLILISIEYYRFVCDCQILPGIVSAKSKLNQSNCHVFKNFTSFEIHEEVKSNKTFQEEKELLYSKIEKLWHINIASNECLNVLTYDTLKKKNTTSKYCSYK